MKIENHLYRNFLKWVDWFHNIRNISRFQQEKNRFRSRFYSFRGRGFGLLHVQIREDLLYCFSNLKWKIKIIDRFRMFLKFLACYFFWKFQYILLFIRNLLRFLTVYAKCHCWINFSRSMKLHPDFNLKYYSRF
jgi:hypothetical protein